MIVSQDLRRALRRVFFWWKQNRGPTRDAMRPIPDHTIAMYHRAIWSLDTLGPGADADRQALRDIWGHATVVAANASGQDGPAIAQDLIRTLNEQCERVVRETEKDGNRPEWQKQRDFLLGSLRRVRRACAMNDVGHLHFYKRTNEPFNLDLHQHPTYQIGYHLWQGVVREMKDAISFAVYRDKPPPHLQVEWLMKRIRQVIKAIEFADLTGFEGYKSSDIYVSQDLQAQVLWTAVRDEIALVIAQAEGMGAAA